MMLSRIKKLFQTPEMRYTSKEIFHWLWNARCGNRKQAVLNALIGVLSVVVSLATVWAVQHAIDVASHVAEGSIYTAVSIMGALILCDFALSITSVWVKNLLDIKTQNRTRQRVLDRILRSEWHGKEHHHNGGILNRLELDVANVVSFLAETIPSSVSTLAMFLGAFFYLTSMDWRPAIITVVMIPLFVLIDKVYICQMRRLTHEVHDSDSKVQSVLQKTIQYRMLIKTPESDEMIAGKLEGTQHELRRKAVRRTKFFVFSNLVLDFGFAFGYLVAFTWAVLRMSAHSLTFGGMTAFLQLVNRIQNPARQLTKLVPAFASVFTAAERLMELEENPLEGQGEPIEVAGSCGIRLGHADYRYDDAEREILKDLDFNFYPGSCTVALGETGAGKTTLVRMFLALLKLNKGSVEIYNEKEGRELTPLIRTNFAYIPQGNTLLSGTIRESLLLGKVDATEEKMIVVPKKSCADFVFHLPLGFDTFCSEQGGGLSEGQAQRIAIARSLLHDRSIMIFDEATLAPDPQTERGLLRNILSNHDKTVIFITHRPAVVDYCDQTLTIKKIQ